MAERLVAFVGSRFALLLALVVTGCGGSERANVTGKLTHRDGSPLVARVSSPPPGTLEPQSMAIPMVTVLSN